MYKSIILPLAIEDLRQSAAWYNSKQKGLGKIFTTEVRSIVHFIKHHPKAYSIRYNEVRVAPLKSFPYLIHYSIDEIQNLIIISAIFHTSINPTEWQNRLK